MDTVFVATRCLACHTEVNRPLRWFNEHARSCPACGGPWDTEPLRTATKVALEDYYEALRGGLLGRDSDA
jgi:hypothetical protein